ncbi:hypothetical protein KIN20_022285 [Parelaphostrongylus tenuis]|uniref:Uncharacterized protein n=1 Tax=Parelaphostrongylus tenuis TaxID=148309 RepID=A0AAD5QV96_PARTN|nr:hypothetical protein KIN20_022285 [Parelaphostrongylus tenuis]
MAQRLTPSLAIAFMSEIEAPVMDLRSILYCLSYVWQPSVIEKYIIEMEASHFIDHNVLQKIRAK